MARRRRSPSEPGPRAGAKGRRAKGGRGILGRIVLWGAVGAVWALVGLAALVATYAYGLPDIDAAIAATRRPSVTLLAADGGVIATYGDLYGEPVRLADLPPALPAAVLATEDRRFYSHFGLDPIGIARALLANLGAGRVVAGGSTITQQLAKNLFLTPERTLKRKVQEVLLALWLERRFSKDQILTLYLNRVYLGAGAYGVDAAARRYFGRPAARLDIWQSAMIAGLLKAPSAYNPLGDPARAERRTRQVLANMLAAGYLDARQAAAVRPGRAAPSQASGPSARHFGDWVLDQLDEYVGGGPRDLVVVTTLDARLQARAEALVETALARPGRELRAGEGAIVAMAPDGAVRAMVGGRDYGESQFNRATQALRQPGSAFKPFVYLAAAERGLTPETRLLDAPITIDGWRPENFDERYLGEVTAREAMARSLNSVAVRVMQRAGGARVAEVARRLGITATLRPGPSLALGTSEVSLIEMVGAFAPFANGGSGVWPYGIVEVRDREGRVLHRRRGSGPGRVVAPREVAAINDMLHAAVEWGTGRAARLDGRAVAGKTGTTQSYRDAWFVGYSADYVAGVWIGNDDGAPMKEVTGGSLPARLWHDLMAAAHRGLPPRPLPGLGPGG
ncbi:MAG: PBP1A family penicillin-binding protein [Proteobacteria bacterium]|nr:PBP1A family penicillin-binding protein [Pseudomonadota bacterium]